MGNFCKVNSIIFWDQILNVVFVLFTRNWICEKYGCHKLVSEPGLRDSSASRTLELKLCDLDKGRGNVRSKNRSPSQRYKVSVPSVYTWIV